MKSCVTFQENRVGNILTLKTGQLTRQNVFQCDLIFVTSNYFILKDNTASLSLKFCLNGRLKPRHTLVITNSFCCSNLK